jgi:hypothetical protein
LRTRTQTQREFDFDPDRAVVGAFHNQVDLVFAA